MDPIKATVIFCEGDHDVAFCHLILKHILKAKVISSSHLLALWPIGKLAKTFLSNQLKDPKLNYLSYKYYYEWNGQAIFLYRTSGMGQIALSKTLIAEISKFLPNGKLASFEPSIEERKLCGKKISSVKYLFVYDSDERSMPELVKWWRDNYGQIEDVPGWPMSDSAGTISGKGCSWGSVAIYGWSVGEDTNTLEDILKTVFAECTDFPFRQSEQFAERDSGWIWQPRTSDKKSESAIKAEKCKAILTISGQHLRPGRALSAIIQDCLKEGGTKESPEKVGKFVSNSHAKDFADFVSKFMM